MKQARIAVKDPSKQKFNLFDKELLERILKMETTSQRA